MFGKILIATTLGALSLTSAPEPGKKAPASQKQAVAAGNTAQGKKEFQQCAFCHDNGAAGPNLKALFKHKTLADKKTPVTIETVRKRIVEGGTGMPPFTSLNTKQLDDLIAYLKTL